MGVEKQHYVVGLMFDKKMENVVLIEKRHGPKCVIGKLNGVGGHIEPGIPHQAEQDDVVGRPNCPCGCRPREKPRHAMAREFLEETGVETSPADWTYFCELTGEDFVVYLFWATSDEAVLRVATKTDEPVHVLPVSRLIWNSSNQRHLCPNLNWMIPFLVDRSTARGFVRVTATYKKDDSTTTFQA